MQQFSVVLQELRKWFESMKWYHVISPFQLYLLFGGLGVMFLNDLLYQIVPSKGYDTLTLIFHTIPIATLAYFAFLLGVWVTLVSANVKYTPYGLWLYVFVYLFPFTNMDLADLVRAGVYALLGYALFKFTASGYAER